MVLGPDFVAYTDPTENPRLISSQLYVAALFPYNQVITKQQQGHALGIASDYDGKPFTYYAGSAWSAYDVRTPAEWQERIAWTLRALRHPLTVRLTTGS